MRLIQFTASKGWRGHEQKIIYLYEAFKENNFVEDQWIICPENSEIHSVAKEKMLNVITFKYKSEYDFNFAKELKNTVKKLNVNLIFIHSSQAHTISVLSAVFFGLNIPLVLCRTLIRRVDTNLLRKWKYNYNGIKKIICVSQPVVDVLKFAVKDHSKLCVVGSVTDIEKFQKKTKTGILHEEFSIPKEYKLIGNIAEFTGFKDHYTWINTVAELKKRNLNAKFILVGKGSLENDVRKQVAALGLDDDVIFAGFRKDIPEILPEFDLFLFTSNNEPTGGVLLESYACKIPIVAANAGGIPEVVINNETGLLAEVGNPISFADKVQEMLENKELQEKCITSGYQFLINNFTKDVISKKMIEELSAVLK